MPEITCTKQITFCAAHRLYNYIGPCENIHGHNYIAELTFERIVNGNLDSLGMVIDFKEIKEEYKNWIDTNWDHSLILNEADEHLINFFQKYRDENKEKMKLFIMKSNPTAENMANYLLSLTGVLMWHNDIKPTKVRVYETPTSYAEAIL
jgi:6-pyruvoyltetrahydropterin/6-carboxytetrahydropterin synthase